MGQSRPLFVYFRYFLITISIQIEKSIDGVLGIRTWGCRMVGADETMELLKSLGFKLGNLTGGRRMLGAHKSTEIWRPPSKFVYQTVAMKPFFADSFLSI